jgi:hypothetical protein
MYNKYKNKKVETNGIIFASVKEYKRYKELKLLEKAGEITNLELQKKYELQPKYVNNDGKIIRAIHYIADFVYYDKKKNKYIIEDTKGYRTEVYKLKKKMFEYKYDLVIKEI